MGINVQNINWKRHLNTLLKVMMDMKVLGLFIMMGFTFYGIGWDTVLRPSLEQMAGKESSIEEQRKILTEKGNLKEQYKVWDQQLKSLDAQMIPIAPNDQPNLIALTVVDELRRMARGENRDETVLPSLPPPHNVREKVELVPTGNPETVDLLKTEGEAAAAAPAQPAAETPGPGKGMGERGGGESAQPTTLPVERFDYELKLSGTYPALMDVLNQLVMRKKVVKINKVTISKPSNTEEPDVQDDPLYPVKLDMVVSLSIFLYAADSAVPRA